MGSLGANTAKHSIQYVDGVFARWLALKGTKLSSLDKVRCLMNAPGHIGSTRPKLVQFVKPAFRTYFSRTRERIPVVLPFLVFPKQFSHIVYAVGSRRGWYTQLVVVLGR